MTKGKAPKARRGVRKAGRVRARSGRPTATGARGGVREAVLGLDALLAFARAGGTVPLATWIGLPEDVQGALAEAGTAVRAEFALAVAAAVRSPEGAEAVAEWAPGGRAASDEVAVRRALDVAAGLLTRVRPATGGGAA